MLEILAKGQLQVSKEEREQKQGATYTEVAKLVAERCINPDTKKPYTIAQVGAYAVYAVCRWVAVGR